LNFSATTSFPMDPADHNAPPYTSFNNPNPNNPSYTVTNIGSQTMLNDVDINNNGVLDVQNIFPFAIRREVTLLGTRTTADHLEGTYIEAILGVLPNSQRIYMTGTFTLDRDTLTPDQWHCHHWRERDHQLHQHPRCRCWCTNPRRDH